MPPQLRPCWRHNSPRYFRHRLLTATTLSALLGASALPASAIAATVPGQVSFLAVPEARTGTAPDDRSVGIAVHIALRNLPALKQFVANVSKPGSATYGHYLTPNDMRDRFAPDAADVEAVRALLTNAGMTAVKVGPMGVSVSARATVAQLRATFGVSQDLYRYGNGTLRANREAPTIPAALSGKILYIEGLDDTTLLKHPNHLSVVREESPALGLAAIARLAPGVASAVTPPPVSAQNPSPYCSTFFGSEKVTLSTAPAPYNATMPWLGCGYTPQQMQAAYGLQGLQYDGTGVIVAIVDAYASPTLEADSNSFAANHKLPKLTSANFSQIIPDGIYNVNPSDSCGPQGWWGEQSLDMAAVHGAAPGATILYVGSEDCGSSLETALENVIFNKLADIVTNSYGYTGEPGSATLATGDQDYMAAAAMGETLLFSSGDDGDIDQLVGREAGSYPSTSPYVTAVGGTSVELFGPAGKKTEVGWGTARASLNGFSLTDEHDAATSGTDVFSFYAGAGGGPSFSEAQPDYQASIVPPRLSKLTYDQSNTAFHLGGAKRVVPDVAMMADPYTGYLYGESFTVAGNAVADHGCTPTSGSVEYCENSIGGTSLASPLMAGVIARVNQARKAAGNPAVGFANPWLYGMPIGTTMNSAGINDVLPPGQPMAVLRAYASAPTSARLVTLNSVPLVDPSNPGSYTFQACTSTLCEGLDDQFLHTTRGYDNVTGLGVPYGPAIVQQ